MGTFKKWFRSIKKFPDWVFYFPAFLLKFLFCILYRFEFRDPYKVAENTIGGVGLAWHNRLLYFPAAFPKRIRKRCVAVVSASRDGQYVTDFIRCFGIGSLRGSSSRGGANALHGAFKAIEEGKNVIFTPDGPRGPRYKVKPGPIKLASRSGAPIVPLAINYSKCWCVKSWDRFQIPKPGAKITVEIGEPIFIPADLDENALKLWQARIDEAMQKLNIDPPGC